MVYTKFVFVDSSSHQLLRTLKIKANIMNIKDKSKSDYVQVQTGIKYKSSSLLQAQKSSHHISTCQSAADKIYKHQFSV